MQRGGTGPRTAAPCAWPLARYFCLPRLPRLTRALDCQSVREMGLGDTDKQCHGLQVTAQTEGRARASGRGTWEERCGHQGAERVALSAVGLETNQTTGNCRWEARPGRAGRVASSRVPDPGQWDVWKASISSSEPPEPTLPRAAALPMVLGPRAQHMAPLSGFWHRRGIYFLDEAAKIVLHLCSRAWYSRSRHFLTGLGKSNSKWIQGGCWLRTERLRGRAFRGLGRLMAGKTDVALFLRSRTPGFFMSLL